MADDSFDYERRIDVRYRDLDSMGHVNHAVYASYCEQARIEFLREAVGLAGADPEMVVARLELDYERPIEFGDEVTVAVGVGDRGRTSFGLRYEIRVDGERAATAETTQVVVDGDGRPRAIPDGWRDVLDAASAAADD